MPAHATGRVLRGIVRDSSHNILPAVKVSANGAKTVTNDRGEFSLELPTSAKGPLIVEKAGYGERHLPLAAGGESMEITLTPNQNDAGLIRYTTKLSITHSLTTVESRERAWLKEPLTEEVYRKFVAVHGEEPPEDVIVRVYLPPGGAPVAGAVLISEHGIGGPMMEHRMTRAFADRHQFALVGLVGDPVQRGIYPAKTLDALLTDVARTVKHPELARVPIFTFGHSNGTGFLALTAALEPDRVVGWVSYHSGGSWHLVFPGIEKSPGLVVHGLHDQYFVNGQAEAIKGLRQERNAPVSALVEGEGGHWPTNRERMYALVLAFYEACLRVRAPHGLALGTTLAPIDVASGWLADRYDPAIGGMQRPVIAPYGAYHGDGAVANWLPDATFARQWQQFSATGAIAADAR